MKLQKLLSFLLVCTAIFFIGCHGGNKPDYPEDDDTDTVSDIDSDLENDDADTSENETDEDQTPASDSDIDGNPTDEPHPHDDADSEPTDTDDKDDADSEPTDTDDKDDTDKDDADSGSDDDVDTETEDADTETGDADTETGDEDSIQEADDPETICTGQTKCFNNKKELACPTSPEQDFFGQDAQYANKGYCLAKSLDATTDLVTDNITGLVWQRNLPSTYAGCSGSDGSMCSYSEAENYCNNLNYAGKTDWRLPTPKELGTIIDFSDTPAIDQEKFPDTPGNLFWTSGSYDGDKNWAVNFMKGETTSNKTTGAQSYLYVRCVSGGSLPNASFTVSGTDEKVVKDSVNNLTWTQSFGSNKTWQDALDYCKNLEEYAGLTEWRLPNINELKTLINYSKSKPASDFEGMTSSSFWSSTSYQGDPKNAWAILMEYGTTTTKSKDNEYKVICVK